MYRFVTFFVGRKKYLIKTKIFGVNSITIFVVVVFFVKKLLVFVVFYIYKLYIV